MLKKKLIFDFNGVDTSYLTHSLHPYPAKFPPQLPKTILKQFSKKGETVLDPFCGSGTTLVEARLQGINAVGVDVNNLFCLLSKVKLTPLKTNEVNIVSNFVKIISNESFKWKMENKSKVKVKEFEGLKHWFQLNVAEEITFILSEIEKLNDNDVKDFLKIVLSSIIVRVSNQESDVRFASINKNIEDCYTFDLFVDRTKECCKKIIEYSNLLKYQTKVKIYNADSRNLSFIEPQSIDIIITSPPYANTYDYYLYHKFRQRWLGLDVHFAQYNEIGSRREYSSLKENSKKWKDDLIKCFIEMNRVLKNKGMAFIIIGDSVIKKELIKIDETIKSFAHPIGFVIRDIISSDLANHSKIFNPTFAQKSKKEHLIILQKNNGGN
jgi:site-specific DNA-methyltransferase (cytosine-N4-specific)